jgi:hypothetical protein
MSHHVYINAATNIQYWILYNATNDRYLSGITEIGQITEANDRWSLHLSTEDVDEWTDECLSLGISHDLS